VLAAVSLNLQSIRNLSETASIGPHLDKSIRIVEEALAKTRQFSTDSPNAVLNHLGLAAGLRWYAGRYSQRHGLAINVTGDADLGLIPQEINGACFGIAREALTNIVRHARATNVTLHAAKRNGQLHLAVSDNGIGFETRQLMNGTVTSRTLGLQGMFEHALAVKGSLKITSVPGKGTLVLVHMPIG